MTMMSFSHRECGLCVGKSGVQYKGIMYTDILEQTSPGAK